MLMKYEIIIVFDSNLDEETVKQQVQKVEAVVTAHGGAVEVNDLWGRRQLAYPIKKRQYGIFVLMVATGDNTLVSDLRRQLRINDAVLRSFIVKKDKYAPDLAQRLKEDNAVFEGGQDSRRERGMGYLEDMADDGAL